MTKTKAPLTPEQRKEFEKLKDFFIYVHGYGLLSDRQMDMLGHLAQHYVRGERATIH